MSDSESAESDSSDDNYTDTSSTRSSKTRAHLAPEAEQLPPHERNPLELLDKMVTVVEEPYTEYVDCVQSAFVARGEALEAASRARVEALDECASLRRQLASARSAVAEANNRADVELERAEVLHEEKKKVESKLGLYSKRLRISTNASVGLQVILDQSFAQVRSLCEETQVDELMIPHEMKTKLKEARVKAKELMRGLYSLELIASRQYSSGEDLLMDAQAVQALNEVAMERAKEAEMLREERAAARLQHFALKKYVWKRKPVAGESWEQIADRRAVTAKVSWGTGDDDLIGEDGGRENLEMTDEERLEAAALKKERSREAAREKLQKAKELKRQKQAEEAARRATAEEVPEPEPEPEPEPPDNFDFMAALGIGGDEPSAQSDNDSDNSGSDSDGSGGGNPLFFGSDSD